jgi:hypothetical protein
MSDATFHTTKQDIRKDESKIAQSHGGKTPANSDVSQMKVSDTEVSAIMITY